MPAQNMPERESVPLCFCTFREALMCMFIVLLPFQDTGLQRTALQYFGTSLSVFPLTALVALDVCSWLRNPRRRIQIPLTLASLWCALVTLFYLIDFGVQWAGVDLRVKALKNIVMTLLALWTITRPDWKNFRFLRGSIWVAFAITLCGVAFGDLNMLGLKPLLGGPLFHGNTATLDNRWRSFSPEASMFSLAVGNIGLLSAAIAGSALASVSFLVLTIATLSLSGSKGGLLCIIAATVFASMLNRQRRFATLCCLIAMIPFALIGYEQQRKAFTPTSMIDTTTFASRATLVFWAVDVGFTHPLGVGYSGFYPALTKYLPKAMDTTASLSPIPLNLEEVRSYTSSDFAASTKSGFMDFFVLFGFPFALVFGVWNWQTVQACAANGKTLLLIAVLFDLIGFCTYNNSLIHYNTFLVLGLARNEYTCR